MQVWPQLPNEQVELYITFATPELLQIGDTLLYSLAGFSRPYNGMSIVQQRSEFDITWDDLEDVLTINVIAEVSRLANSINVTLVSPLGKHSLPPPPLPL